MPVRVVLGGLGDVVEAVPGVLGFVPSAGSVVVLLLDRRGVLVAAARVDAGDGAGLDSVVETAVRHTVTGCLLVGYDEPVSPGASGGLLAAAGAVFAGAGIEVLGIAQVCGSRWRAGLSGGWEPVTGSSAARAELVLAWAGGDGALRRGRGDPVPADRPRQHLRADPDRLPAPWPYLHRMHHLATAAAAGDVGAAAGGAGNA